MAVGPFGIWRKLDADELAALAEGEDQYWLVREFSGIYEACQVRGLKPREVDALEVWEVASILGMHRGDDDDEDEDPATARIPDRPTPRARGRGGKAKTANEMTSAELIRARVLHKRDPDRYPLPEQRATTSGVVAGLTGAIGG